MIAGVIFLLIMLGICIGTIVGLLIANRLRPVTVGTIRMNTDDPDGPYLFLELVDGGLIFIEHSDEVILKVKLDSHK